MHRMNVAALTVTVALGVLAGVAGQASALAGVGAPKGTPAEIIEKLNSEINAGLANPKMKSRFADLGLTPLPLSAADFAKLVVDETEKWGKVVKFANIKPE